MERFIDAMKAFYDSTLFEKLTFVVVSIWGSSVAFYHRYSKMSLTTRNVIEYLVELFTSGFIGLMTYYVCKSFSVSHELTAVIIGINSFTGIELLVLCSKQVKKKIESIKI